MSSQPNLRVQTDCKGTDTFWDNVCTTPGTYQVLLWSYKQQGKTKPIILHENIQLNDHKLTQILETGHSHHHSCCSPSLSWLMGSPLSFQFRIWGGMWLVKLGCATDGVGDWESLCLNLGSPEHRAWGWGSGLCTQCIFRRACYSLTTTYHLDWSVWLSAWSCGQEASEVTASQRIPSGQNREFIPQRVSSTVTVLPCVTSVPCLTRCTSFSAGGALSCFRHDSEALGERLEICGSGVRWASDSLFEVNGDPCGIDHSGLRGQTVHWTMRSVQHSSFGLQLRGMFFPVNCESP